MYAIEIRSIQPVQTFDNTLLELELAGFSKRILAAVIDMVAIGAILLAIALTVQYLQSISPQLAETLYNLVFPRGLFQIPFLAVFFAMIIGASFVGFTYYFLQEWLWQGQTLGKVCLKIRVVRQNGQPIGVWESFGRNILRFFMDVYPIGLGLYPVLISGREKRFGDFLAGTIVINDEPIAKPLLTAEGVAALLNTSPEDFSKETEAYHFYESVSGHLLQPDELELVRNYLVRRTKLTADARKKLARSIDTYLERRLGWPELSDSSLTAIEERFSQLCQGYQEALVR